MTIKDCIELFTTRELATIVWLLILLVCVICNKKARKSLADVIEIFFGKQLRKIWITIIIYIIGITFLLSLIPVWKNIYIKDVLVWFFSSGFLICMNSISAEADDKYITSMLKDKMKISILSEFLLSTFTFSFWVELLFLPFMTFMTLLKTFSENKEEYKDVNKFFDYLFVILGIWIISGTIHVGLEEYRNMNGVDTLVGFFIPIIYLVAVVPLMFVLELISKYQMLFVRMSFMQNDDKRVKRQQRLLIFNECRFSIKRITYFQCNYMYKMYKNMTPEEFETLIQQFRKGYMEWKNNN